MAEQAPLAGVAGAPYEAAGGAEPPPFPADGAAGGDAEFAPPVDLVPQAKQPARLISEAALVLIPLCRKGDRVGIEGQVQAGTGTVEERDIEGNTPLHVAVEAPRNEIATVQCLLELGADVNAVNMLGAAPLHYVCLRKSNHRGIANVLLENGAEINCLTHAGKSPLHFACEQQNPELVEVLLVFGAEPSLSDVEGNTPMHLTMAKPSGRDTVKRHIASHLLEYNAVFHSANLQGVAPLHIAAQGGFIRSLSLLLERQADIATPTARGELALHLACANHQSEVTQLLVQMGLVTINTQDVEGNTPLHICASIGNLDSALLLLRNGADTAVKNNQRKNALELSRLKGTDLSSTHNPDLVQLLKDAQKGGSCLQA